MLELSVSLNDSSGLSVKRAEVDRRRMTWADVGAVLVGFFAFAGVGATGCFLAARAQMKKREHGAVEWLDVLDAFEGTPPGSRR
jgi:hypothetical protein